MSAERLNADQIRTLALQNPGMFASMFARAPRVIRYQGETYVRDAARTVNHKLAYLGMAAMTQPAQVAALAHVPMGFDSRPMNLDADPSAMSDAQSKVRDAEGKVRAARAALAGLKRKRDEMRKNLSYEQDRRNAVKADVATFLTFGISTAQQAIAHDNAINYWTEQIRQLESGTGDWQGKGIADAQAALDAANAELASAKAALLDAKRAYDADLKAQRDAEEQARIQAATDDANRLAAQSDYTQRMSDAGAAAQAQEDTFMAALPDTAGPEQLDADEMDDLFGAFGLEHAKDVGGADADDRVWFVSPYGFDAYYGCRCSPSEKAQNGGRCACGVARSLDEAFGLDTDAVPSIIGNILRVAGDVVNSTTKPPSVESVQGSGQPPPSWLTDVLKASGVQGVIDDASKKAGAGAEKNTKTLLIVGGIALAIALGVAIFAVAKK